MGNPRGVTASAVISFAEQLEESGSTLYTELARRFPSERETFAALAAACERNKVSVRRTYRETISDALEAGFSFEGLKLSDYQVDQGLAADAEYDRALERAIALEGTASEFYADVAKRSRSLLATIAMAFASASKAHKRQKRKLESLR